MIQRLPLRPHPQPPTASAPPARGGLPAPGTRYSPIYAISSAGTLHVLGPVSGIDVQRPAPFLPPNARYSDLAAVNGMLYTSTSNGCGGGANGVWAITLDESEARQLVADQWRKPCRQSRLYQSTARSSSRSAAEPQRRRFCERDCRAECQNAPADRLVLQQQRRHLQRRRSYSCHGGVEIVAAATEDGRVFLLDASALGGADHSTPLFELDIARSSQRPRGSPLSSWTVLRWLLVPGRRRH